MRRRDRQLGYGLLVVVEIVATVAAFVLSGGSFLVGLVPLAATLLVVIVWATPIPRLAGAFLFVALLFDNPQERPYEGEWTSPLYPVGRLLYTNLNEISGVGFLRFSLLEFLIVALLGIVMVRRVRGDPEALVPEGGSIRVLAGAAGAVLAGVVLLEGWGLLRGGDFRQSLWQARQLVWLAPLTLLFLQAFRGRSDYRMVVGILIAVALIRAAVGFVYFGTVVVPARRVPDYITTHADSSLFIQAIFILILTFLEEPRWRHVRRALVIGLPLGAAFLLNDRRLGFVALFGSLLAAYILMRPEIRRVINRVVLTVSPILLLYAGVGWNFEDKRIFRPVNVVKSVLASDDTSNESRDVENLNLIFTVFNNPVIGSGFGHPYDERIVTYRIDQFFAQYRYMPHNSVLWLWSVGGLIGFPLIWMILPLAVLVARRAYLRARDTSDRVAALATVAAVLTYQVQAFGDIGMQSWMTTLILASWLGLGGNVARRLNAMQFEPEPVRGRVLGDTRRPRPLPEGGLA